MDHGKRWDGADPLPIDFPQVLPIHVVTASWERSRKRESHTREGRRLLADMLQFPDSPLLLPIGVLRGEARSSLSDLSLDFLSLWTPPHTPEIQERCAGGDKGVPDPQKLVLQQQSFSLPVNNDRWVWFYPPHLTTRDKPA